jgi:hypothetical protein
MDFEATLKPVTKDDEVNKKSDSTSKYQEHIPNSCGLKYNCIMIIFQVNLFLHYVVNVIKILFTIIHACIHS